MLTRRTFLGASVASGAGFNVPARAGRPRDSSGHPVLVELFTSQGCSSCPPADVFLGELSARADVITLGYHIDYWDHIGWRDPFSRPEFTARQRAYARTLGNSTIYTPQMVIDGRFDRIGSRRREIEATLAHLADAGPAERISVPITLKPGAAGSIGVRVPTAHLPDAAELMVASTLARHVTEVRRGENSGRRLVDHDVVLSLTRLGLYRGQSAVWSIPGAALGERADRLTVWLQAPGHGPIWGAATLALAGLG